MIIMVGGRQWGKTTELIRLASERGWNVVTFSRERCNQLKHAFPEFPYKFFTPGDIKTKGCLTDRPYCIDDLELCLKHFFPKNLQMISMNAQRHPMTMKQSKDFPHLKETHKYMSSIFEKDFEYNNINEQICNKCKGIYGQCSCD